MALHTALAEAISMSAECSKECFLRVLEFVIQTRVSPEHRRYVFDQVLTDAYKLSLMRDDIVVKAAYALMKKDPALLIKKFPPSVDVVKILTESRVNDSDHYHLTLFRWMGDMRQERNKELFYSLVHLASRVSIPKREYRAKIYLALKDSAIFLEQISDPRVVEAALALQENPGMIAQDLGLAYERVLMIFRELQESSGQYGNDEEVARDGRLIKRRRFAQNNGSSASA